MAFFSLQELKRTKGGGGSELSGQTKRLVSDVRVSIRMVPRQGWELKTLVGLLLIISTPYDIASHSCI